MPPLDLIELLVHLVKHNQDFLSFEIEPAGGLRIREPSKLVQVISDPRERGNKCGVDRREAIFFCSLTKSKCAYPR